MSLLYLAKVVFYREDMNTNEPRNLFIVISLLPSEKECARFFTDLLTEQEIAEFSNRWNVAQLLDKKIGYEEITKETGMSSTTIARISKCLTRKKSGYKAMIEKLKSISNSEKNHHHTSLIAE